MTRARLRWLLVVTAVFLWMLAILPAYYVVHKPFGAATLYAIADTLANLFTWLALFLAATALGSRLTRRLPYHSPLERVVMSAGLGLGIISLLTFLMALAGLLYGWLFWILIAATCALLWREIAAVATHLRGASWRWPPDRWSQFLILFVVASLLLTLLIALLPPTEWDSLVYHLVGPEIYLRAHRLVSDLDNYYLLFPSFTEMLFTAGMALKGDIVAHLIHFGYLLLTLGGLIAFAIRYWHRSSGLTAVALFLSIPTVLLIAAWSYVDLALTFYNLAALYALLAWHESSDPSQPPWAAPGTGWLILAGAFAGASLSIKYTGIATLLTLGALLLWWSVRRRAAARRLIAAGLVVTVVALAAGGAWYVKNALVTGNPIYPVAWGGREWNDISTRWLLTLGEEKSLLDLLLIPWTLTVVGTQGTPVYDATFSPLFLLLLPLLLFVRREGRWIPELLVAATVGYLFWIASGAASSGRFVLQGRMLLPIFAPLSLLAAYALSGMEIWDRPLLSVQRLLKMVVVLILAVVLVGQALTTLSYNPWPYLAGFQSRQDYLDQYVTQRLNPAIRYLNENLDAGDRVLFFWELRSYRLEAPAQPDTLLDNFSQALASHGPGSGLVAGLRHEGFTHLLVNHYVYPWIVTDFPITAAEQGAWEEFDAEYLTDEARVHSEGEYLAIYRLPPAAAP